MSKKVRLGFVGCGYMGQIAHIANYATIPDCELVALAEGRQNTAKAVAQKYGISEVYTNHKEMLEKADLDGVVAIMWYSLHHAVVPDIIAAGLPVATEKPMCVRVETAQKMAKAAEDKGVLYQVGYMKRHDPASKLVKDTIKKWKETGECGKLGYIRVTMPSGDWIYQMDPPVSREDTPPAYDQETPEPMPEWMPDPMKNLYNAFINFYIHQVDLVRYLIGEDYTVNYVDPGQKMLVATSDSGATCVIEMASYGLQNTWHEYYKICFDGGKIDLQIPAPLARQRAGNVRIYKGSAQETVEPELPQRWGFLEQARHFVECIRDGKPTISPASDAIKDLEISEQFIKCVMNNNK
jgi:predicted dehydrogenase